MSSLAEFTNQFFADCATDNRQANEINLRAWLWFTCPASMRTEVENSIRADERWPYQQRELTLRFRVTESERDQLHAAAEAEGVTVSQYIRSKIL